LCIKKKQAIIVLIEKCNLFVLITLTIYFKGWENYDILVCFNVDYLFRAVMSFNLPGADITGFLAVRIISVLLYVFLLN